MSQYALAQAANVSREYVRKLEAGESDATVGMLERLAVALQVPLLDLLENREGWLTEESLEATVFSTRKEAEAVARARGSEKIWRLRDAGTLPRIFGQYRVRNV